METTFSNIKSKNNYNKNASKLSSFIKIFKPWKWKRRKKCSTLNSNLTTNNYNSLMKEAKNQNSIMILNSSNKENLKENGISIVIVNDSDDSESDDDENFILWRDYYGDDEQCKSYHYSVKKKS